jgi:hypothetical protein
LPPPAGTQLRLDLNRAAASGEFNGSWIALMLLAPLALDTAAVFGYFSGRLVNVMVEVGSSDQPCDDTIACGMIVGMGYVALGGMLLVTATIAVGSAVLGVGGVSQIAGLGGMLGHGYKRRRVNKAYRAGLLRGLGKSLLIGGAIGLGGFGGGLAIHAYKTGSFGWDGWTWPAWLAGLAYSSALVVSGAVLLATGHSWYSSILKRVAVAPLVMPESRGKGLALVIRL